MTLLIDCRLLDYISEKPPHDKAIPHQNPTTFQYFTRSGPDASRFAIASLSARLFPFSAHIIFRFTPTSPF